jgi:hypothetical protein
VTVACRWNYVHLGGNFIDIVLSSYGVGASTVIISSTARIFVNGTENTTVTYPELGTTGSPRVGNNRCGIAAGTRVNSIQVIASLQGTVSVSFGGSTLTSQATASINKTITFTDISPTADFVIVNSEKFIQLPDVTAHNRPIVIKSEGSPKVWIYSRDGTTNIDNRRGVYTDSAYGCITVFTNGTQWFIAGWYRSQLPSTTNTVSAAKTVTAVSGVTNIFSTNASSARITGDNAVVLPTPTTIEMCIIAYTGGTDASLGVVNALQIRHPIGWTIDGYTGANSPYILCHSNVTSTGIVLFRNTTTTANPSGNGKWYIIGSYNTSEWTWSTEPGWNPTADVPTNRQRFILFPSISWQYMTLPMFSPHAPQLLVYKVQAVYNQANGQDEPVVSGGQIGNDPSPMGNNFLNETQRGIIRYSPSEYVCVWFVSEQRSGESFLRYYPIMSYIP